MAKLIDTAFGRAGRLARELKAALRDIERALDTLDGNARWQERDDVTELVIELRHRRDRIEAALREVHAGQTAQLVRVA